MVAFSPCTEVDTYHIHTFINILHTNNHVFSCIVQKYHRCTCIHEYWDPGSP